MVSDIAPPLVFIVSLTASLVELDLAFSIRYLLKKWMVSSTAIPKTIVKTTEVEIFIPISNQPIIANIITKGKTLGNKDITPILIDLNRKLIIIKMSDIIDNKL